MKLLERRRNFARDEAARMRANYSRNEVPRASAKLLESFRGENDTVARWVGVSRSGHRANGPRRLAGERSPQNQTLRFREALAFIRRGGLGLISYSAKEPSWSSKHASLERANLLVTTPFATVGPFSRMLLAIRLSMPLKRPPKYL